MAADFTALGVEARFGVEERLGDAALFEGDFAFLTELPPAAAARRVGVRLRPRFGDGLAPRAFLVDLLRLLETLREAERPRLDDFLRDEEAEDPAKESILSGWVSLLTTQQLKTAAL